MFQFIRDLMESSETESMNTTGLQMEALETRENPSSLTFTPARSTPVTSARPSQSSSFNPMAYAMGYQPTVTQAAPTSYNPYATVSSYVSSSSSRPNGSFSGNENAPRQTYDASQVTKLVYVENGAKNGTAATKTTTSTASNYVSFGWSGSANAGPVSVGYGSNGFDWSVGGSMSSATPKPASGGYSTQYTGLGSYGSSGITFGGQLQYPLTWFGGLTGGISVGKNESTLSGGGYLGLPYSSYQAQAVGTASVPFGYGNMYDSMKNQAKDIYNKILAPIANPATYFQPSMFGSNYNGYYSGY